MSAVNTEEKEFWKWLHALASACTHELTEEHIQIYDYVLSPYGYDKAKVAVKEIMATRSGRDAMPSPKDIAALLQPEVMLESRVELTMNEIISIFRKKGPHYPQIGEWPGIYCTFKEAFPREHGNTVAHVVDVIGGYTHAYNEWNNTEPGVYRTQLRRVVKAVVDNEVANEKEKLLEGGDRREQIEEKDPHDPYR